MESEERTSFRILKLNRHDASTRRLEGRILTFRQSGPLLGTTRSRGVTLNWDNLRIQRHDLDSLEDKLLEEEVREVFMDMQPEMHQGRMG